MLNSDELNLLTSKLNQVFTESSFVDVILAPQELKNHQVFNYKGKNIKSLNSCLKGTKLFIFKDSKTKSYFSLAEPEKFTNGVVNSRQVLRRQTHPVNTPKPKKNLDLSYAIGYEIIKKEENKIEFWVSTANFEKLIYSVDYQIEDETVPESQLPPGYYLAIWSYNFPWSVEDLFLEILL
jgi:hypothetical protein